MGLPALPLHVVPLYFELDGTFPNHEANPLEPENLRDLLLAAPGGPATRFYFLADGRRVKHPLTAAKSTL